jgi:glycosyltransferase involved in cell wall biosynthesis
VISVVIPTLNEQDVIGEAIASLLDDATGCEVLVVDGGSRDSTRSIVRDFGPPVYLADQEQTAPRGRATAYNQAAALARGDILVFLHADTRLPPRGLRLIEEAMVDSRVIGGGFLPKFGGEGRDATWRLLRLVERGWQLRTRRFRWFAGDQAPFVRRGILRASGGYPLVRLAEDWAFAAHLRSLGPIVVIDQPVRVSPRRHVANGVLKTLLVTGSIEVMWRMGINPGFLAWWYRHWLPRERG